MKKRTITAAIGCLVMGSVMLSACSTPVNPSATVPEFPEVIQVQTVPTQEHKISLTSSETVEVVPDMAQMEVTIRTEDASATECQQDNTEKLGQVLEYLKGLGFEDASIRTSGFSLNPRYSWSNNVQKLVGYEMRTNVSVTDIPMDDVGQILTDIVEHGANEIDSVSYFSSQYDQAYNEALERAIALSRSKGEALAAASGKKLGDVLMITEKSDQQYGRYVNAGLTARNEAMKMEAAADAAPMEVMPGAMKVTAEIAVDFALVETEE